jgi:hypothetical protein
VTSPETIELAAIMPELDDDLTPARTEDPREHRLTSDSCPAKPQSAELMASIVAERLIARLERDAFLSMRRARRRRRWRACAGSEATEFLAARQVAACTV